MNYPNQEASLPQSGSMQTNILPFDMRNFLNPKRMTEVVWDFACLTRHMKGDAFEDYDKVLDQAIERGYNTIRIDPLPQVIDLTKPETICSSPPLHLQPFNPWDRPQGFSGPAGQWLIELVQKIKERKLNYCLSAWNKPILPGTTAKNLREMVPLWEKMLRDWKILFGFEGCIYVDLSNEYPYFLDDHLSNLAEEHGPRWSEGWKNFVREEVNSCLRSMRDEFPELLFTVSLHGDTNWIDLGLELDCMDIHFYADADPRFVDRTNFDKISADLFRDPKLYKEYSDRCQKSHKVMAPMYRARQRAKLAAFAAFSQNAGIPLTTSESWASWFYIDHKDLDWTWLLEWSKWSVEDALEYGMWGWTPHNYCFPQFENWKDVEWHKKLTEKFLDESCMTSGAVKG